MLHKIFPDQLALHVSRHFIVRADKYALVIAVNHLPLHRTVEEKNGDAGVSRQIYNVLCRVIGARVHNIHNQCACPLGNRRLHLFGLGGLIAVRVIIVVFEPLLLQHAVHRAAHRGNISIAEGVIKYSDLTDLLLIAVILAAAHKAKHQNCRQ